MGRSRLFASIWGAGARTAFIVDDERWSYEQLWALARGWSAGLRANGVRPGDRVVALAPSSVELVAAMLGTYAIGAIWVPVNPRYPAPEVAHVVSDCAPRLVVVDAQLRVNIPAGIPTCLLEPGSRADAPPQLASGPSHYGALLIYTSGTTGRSKGALLSHEAVTAGIVALTQAWRWCADDQLSLHLPLFHVHGLCIGIHGALLAGMSTRLHAKFSVAGVLADIESGASVFMGVPTMYAQILAHMREHPRDGNCLSSARLFTSGSAALPVCDLLAFERRTGHRIVERYGMSETLITFTNPLAGERRAGSVGRALPGVRARIVDDRGEDARTGELYVQAPSMMACYWGAPAATAAAFDGPWFRTGDVVTREADGYVRIVGRKSVDIIKSGGFKLSAREIEEVLLEHEAVSEVAVVGVADPQWGERVEAVVVPTHRAVREQVGALAATLDSHVRASLAPYKVPRAIHVRTGALPRNAMGKVQKVRLKRELGAQTRAR